MHKYTDTGGACNFHRSGGIGSPREIMFIRVRLSPAMRAEGATAVIEKTMRRKGSAG